MTIYDAIQYTLITISLIACIITLYRSYQIGSDRFFGWLYLIFSLRSIFGLLERYDINTLTVSKYLLLLYGPIYYLYSIRYLEKLEVRKSIRHKAFVPFIFLLEVIVFWVVGLDFLYIIILYQTSYSIYILQLLFQHKKETHLGLYKSLNFHVNKLVHSFLIFNLIFVLDLRYEILHTELLFGLLGLLLIVLIVISLLRDFFYEISLLQNKRALKLKRKNGLSFSEIESHANKIQHYLRHEKPYLRPELTLEEFSTSLDMPSRVVSQVINDVFNSNFSKFVNDYRLMEVCEMLKNHTPKEMNISEIMFNSGFNSKSRFFTLFKEKYGITPKEYRINNAKTKD